MAVKKAPDKADVSLGSTKQQLLDAYLEMKEHLEEKARNELKPERIVEEKKITTLMVTHNLKYAVQYGDRLLMMHQGSCLIDAAGEDKKKLAIDDLLKVFNSISIECGN